MNSYEVLYIIDNTLAEEAREAVIGKFSALITNSGGTIETIDKWGTRKFAYPINFKNEGYYVLMNFTAQPSVPLELERVMKITDAVVRCMVLKK